MKQTTQAGRPKVRRAVYGTVAALSAAALLSACGSDGEYPSEAIEYIIPYNPGGSTDPLGREFANMLTDSLGTTSTPLNMPGGDESIGITHVYGAAPDGYTIGMGSSAGLVGQPVLNDSVQYEGPESFTPIIKMVDVPYALMVSGDSEFETLEDFIDAAKASPGELTVGAPNRMGGSAFTLYALESMADIQTSLVTSTGGSGEAALSVMSGRTNAMVGTAAGQAGLIESGDIRVLAYTGQQDYSDFVPNAQSFHEAGYEIPFSGDYMTLAPADLPDDVSEQLISTAEEIATSDEWAEWTANQGILTDSLVGDELDAWLEEQTISIDNAIEFAENRED